MFDGMSSTESQISKNVEKEKSFLWKFATIVAFLTLTLSEVNSMYKKSVKYTKMHRDRLYPLKQLYINLRGCCMLKFL